MATPKQLTLSSGKEIRFEKHSNFEKPRFYPEKIVRLKNGTVGLVHPHSKHYVPTPENQQKLEKITKHSVRWFYINELTKTH